MSSGSDDQHPAPAPASDGTPGTAVKGWATKKSLSKAGSDEGPATKASAPVGQFLREAYRDTLDEGVPDDMMDLLRKLD